MTAVTAHICIETCSFPNPRGFSTERSGKWGTIVRFCELIYRHDVQCENSIMREINFDYKQSCNVPCMNFAIKDHSSVEYGCIIMVTTYHNYILSRLHVVIVISHVKSSCYRRLRFARFMAYMDNLLTNILDDTMT